MKSKLQEEWDEKLESEGLELVDKIEPPKVRKTYHSIKSYFQSVDNILHTYQFATAKDGSTVRDANGVPQTVQPHMPQGYVWK